MVLQMKKTKTTALMETKNMVVVVVVAVAARRKYLRKKRRLPSPNVCPIIHPFASPLKRASVYQ
jgi:hypothetical protein